MIETDLNSAIITDPFTISPTDPVSEALRLMTLNGSACEFSCDIDAQSSLILAKAKQSCVLVVENQTLVGILTARDLIRLSFTRTNLALAQTLISEVMVTPVLTLLDSEFTDIFVSLRWFQRHHIRHLPLVDPKGVLVGLVTHESLQQLLKPIDLLHFRTASEVITPSLIHAHWTTPLIELAKLMSAHRVSSVVIVDDLDQKALPMGIVSELDLVRLLSLGLDFSVTPAQGVMQAPVFSVQGDQSLWDVSQLMQERQINQVCVTDSQGSLQGILTHTDLLNELDPIELYRVSEMLGAKVNRLEEENLALLQNRNAELEQQVQNRILELKVLESRQRLVSSLSDQIRASLILSEVLTSATTAVRSFLHCDRVLIYRFKADWAGTVVAESVGEGWAASLSSVIQDSCFQSRAQTLFRDGRKVSVENIYDASYSDCHLALLEQFQVKANLVVPILVSDNLWGLLIGHQCQSTRVWQESDLVLLDEISVQLSIAIQQSMAHEQLKNELVERKKAELELHKLYIKLQSKNNELEYTIEELSTAKENLIKQNEQTEIERQRYQNLFDLAPDGYLVTDTLGEILEVNRSLLAELSTRQEHMLGKPFILFVSQADRELLYHKLHYLRSHPKDKVTWELTITPPQREPFPAEITLIFCQDPITHGQQLHWLIRNISARKAIETALIQSEAHNRAVVAAIPDLMFRVGSDGIYRGYVTAHTEFDIIPQEFNPVGQLMDQFLPPELAQRQRHYLQQALLTGEMQIYEQELTIGDHVQEEEVRVVPSSSDEVLFMIRDISQQKAALRERQQAEHLLQIHNTLLQRIAQADPLLDILNALIEMMELQLGRAFISIMFTDAQHRLHVAAAPHLPVGYLQAIEGIEFGEGVGSCGTASYRQERVIVTDIDTDPLWQNYRELASQYGLKACWSDPIINSQGKLLGAFAVYYQEPRTPQPHELNILTLSSNIAGIAVEHHQTTQELERLNQDLEKRIQERTIALQVSEERWQLALEGSNDGVWDWDVMRGRVFYSSRWKAMRGYADHEVSDSKEEWTQGIHPDDYERVMAELSKHFSGGTKFYQSEYRVRHKDGCYFWILDRGKALRDESGQVIRMSGSETNITDRKLAENALQKSEAELRSLFMGMDDVVFVVNREGTYLKVSPTNPDKLIVPAESLIGHTIDEFFTPEETSRFLSIIDTCLISEQTQECEYSLLMGENELVFNAKCSPLDQDSVVWVARDITVRKQAELEVKHKAEQERLVNLITQRIRSSLDLDEILNGTVQEINQVLNTDRALIYRIFEDGTGKTIAESVTPGWPVILNQVFLEEIFPKENYDRYLSGRIYTLTDLETQSILPCLKDFLRAMKVRAKLVVPIVTQDILWGLLIAHQCESPRQWKSWEIEVYHKISLQLSIAIQQSELYSQLQEKHAQLSHLNAELIQATRLKDEFLANMSHELRTPLNAILGLSEALQEEVFGPINDRQTHSLTTIEASGRHLLSLINDILDVSKFAAGKIDLGISTVSMAQLIDSSVAFVKQQAIQKQIYIETNWPKNLSEFAADERRMRQVLINLLNNAVKFTPQGGRVSLQVNIEAQDMNLAERIPITVPKSSQPGQRLLNEEIEQVRSMIAFSITDTGIGIRTSDLPKLFQPFIQIDSTLNRQYEGTGLGLTLVKQIAELHGGSVSVHSELGQGSCFTVRIPFQSPLPSLDSKSTSTDCNLADFSEKLARQPLILLAEDNQANIETFTSYLELKGYQLIVVENGLDAVSQAKSCHPDIILMDIQMPVMDGLTAIQSIRQDPNLRAETLPIIALTALALAGDSERCLLAGANEYLSKPVNLKQLHQSIQRLLSTCSK